MKLIIDISKDRYDEIMAMDWKNCRRFFDEEIRAIHDGIPQRADRWIPVSERLPEKNMRCLVAVGRFNFTQIATYSDLMGTIDHRIFYQGEYGHEDFRDITQYVKAWQRLPEPYKSEIPTGAEGSE